MWHRPCSPHMFNLSPSLNFDTFWQLSKQLQENIFTVRLKATIEHLALLEASSELQQRQLTQGQNNTKQKQNLGAVRMTNKWVQIPVPFALGSFGIQSIQSFTHVPVNISQLRRRAPVRQNLWACKKFVQRTMLQLVEIDPLQHRKPLRPSLHWMHLALSHVERRHLQLDRDFVKECRLNNLYSWVR